MKDFSCWELDGSNRQIGLISTPFEDKVTVVWRDKKAELFLCAAG